jgi:hypothetical protein
LEELLKKTTLIISLLLATLIVSNAWWAYTVLDSGITYTYLRDSYEQNQQALLQSLAITNVLTTEEATRGQVIEAALEICPSSEPFEKEGYYWLGSLGLLFDESDRLVEVVPNL